jgi:two-component system nitrogen regulation response regulator NtrX
VAATNRDLAEDVSAERFREDLFYRLNVIAIEIPPLRDRPEDIPELVAHFIDLRIPEGPAPSLTPGAQSVLLHHDWPGNVRELRNVIDRMLFMADGEVIPGAVARRAIRRRTGSPPGEDEELRSARKTWEKDYITRTLVAHEWNIQETADALGIHRSHLWKKMRALGIRPPAT